MPGRNPNFASVSKESRFSIRATATPEAGALSGSISLVSPSASILTATVQRVRGEPRASSEPGEQVAARARSWSLPLSGKVLPTRVRNVAASDSTPGGRGVLHSGRGGGNPPGEVQPSATITLVIAIHFAAA